MSLSNFIIFDIETIGLQKETGQIIELAAIEVKNWKIVKEYDQLINPGCKVPKLTRDLTGITDKDLVSQPIFLDVADEFLKFIGNLPLVGHNVISFDQPYINYNLEKIGHEKMSNEILDTMELAIFLKPQLKKYKLEYLYNTILNKKVEQTHRAIDDCRQVFELLVGLKKVRDQEWDKNWLDHVGSLALAEKWPWANFILASQAINLGKKIESFLPIENYLKDNNLFRNQPQFENEIKKIDIESIKFYFDKKHSNLKKILGKEKYEYRPQQEEMAVKITQAINNNKFLLAEAPTGCGKSLAYLLPSLVWSLENNNRPVVISTYTNALQDQLFENDFAMLNKIFPQAKITVVKGREHYVCIRKLKMFFDENSGETLFSKNNRYSNRLISLFLANWVIKNAGNNGDFDRFSSWFKNHIKDFDKSEICSDTETCQRRYCKYARKCFLNQLRDAATLSNVVITNHAMLFSDPWDSALSQSMLPKDFNVLVMDEAINLEDSATDASTFKFGRRDFLKLILEFHDPKHPNKGLFNGLMNLLKNHSDQKNIDRLYLQIITVNKIIDESEKVFESIVKMVNVKNLKYDNRAEITPAFIAEIKPYLENVNVSLISLALFINEIIQKYFEEEKDDFYQLLKNYVDRLREYAGMIIFFFDLNKNKFIFYRSVQRDFTDASLNGCYKEIGEYLQQRLFNSPSLKSIIFSSATLTYNQSFDFLNRVWGLDKLPPERLEYLKLDYLFDYENKCLLLLNKDLPRKNYFQPEQNFLEFYPKNSDFIKNILISNYGSALTVFSNREDVEKFSHLIIDDLEENNIPLFSTVPTNDYRIYSASLATVAEEFRENIESCLLGTAGLREGIDVPGPSLEIVILVKMPFAIPFEPVNENRRAIYGDFEGYSLPHCIFDIKQAFGRLIRTKTDEGLVFLIDDRLNKHHQVLVKNFPPKLPVRYVTQKEFPKLYEIIKKTKQQKNRIEKVKKMLADDIIE